MYDILIKNALIVDGTGGRRYDGDIGVKGERIEKIGQLRGEAKTVIDANGKCVSSGLIDAHSHSDYLLALDFPAENLLEQGVTTEICGPCGESAVPCYPGFYDNYRQMLPDETIVLLESVQGSIAGFTEYMSGRRLSVNVGMMVGNGTVRGNAMGFTDRIPSPGEMSAMRRLVRSAMENGFLGLSSGLCYPPSSYAGEEELISLARVAAEYGGVYSSHIRSESDHIVAAVEEAVRVAESARLPLVLSHHKVVGRQNTGMSKETLAIADAANARGVKVYLDQYPYLAGCANLVDAIPARYRSEGWPALKKRLVDISFRKELKSLIEGRGASFENFIGNTGYGGTRILICPVMPVYEGKSLDEIAAMRGEEPFDAFLNILAEHDANLFASYAFTCEWDLYNIMAHPNVMVGSDMYRNFERHNEEEPGHPRGTAAFTRYLRLIREKGICSLEEIIRRMTGLPASVYSLPERGLVKEGYFADLCLFDYAAVADRADFAHAYRRGTGIDTVLVNGQIAVENGRANGMKNGSFIKRATEKTC